jgi:hypothetical protein
MFYIPYIESVLWNIDTKIRLLTILGSTVLVTIITLLSIGMLTQESTVNNSTSTANNLSSTNTTQSNAVDVVVMACYANGEGAPTYIPFEVLASSSSANAPEVDSGSNCAQVLADLLSAGFAIEDVQPSPINGAGAYYTLVRYTADQTGNTEYNSTADEDGSTNAIAREFLLSKLPTLGIQIENELQLHTDMIVAETESEYTVEFSVIDQDGHSHDGRVEISNGDVMFAEIDDKSVL